MDHVEPTERWLRVKEVAALLRVMPATSRCDMRWLRWAISIRRSTKAHVDTRRPPMRPRRRSPARHYKQHLDKGTCIMDKRSMLMGDARKNPDAQEW